MAAFDGLMDNLGAALFAVEGVTDEIVGVVKAAKRP
jgi:hypothetical protein